MARIGLYSDAMIYDVLHTPGTAAEVDGLERMAARYARTRGRHRQAWLEPACGSGRFLRVAAGRGTPIVGVDLDPGMVAYANRRLGDAGAAGRARAVVGDITDMGGLIPDHRFDFAFNLINTIRHLRTDAAMVRHLREIRRVLRPGGVYAVGISLSDPAEVEEPSEDVWTAARGRVRVRQLVSYLPQTEPGSRVERIISHLEISRPGGVEHRDSSYELRTYTLAQWEAVVRKAGLARVACVDERGDEIELFVPGYAIHLLRTPERDHARE
ncbi:MAG: class I SAM-dependent methyltransferase [Phycisphaeraceae bacterium]|nr:class I SAM-dependent methyltransferase [Phycisphaeraceae bacterium]